MRRIVVLMLVLVVVLTTLAVTGGTASAATVNGGKAVLILEPGMGFYLGEQKQFILPVAPASVVPLDNTWRYTMPVSGGRVSLASLVGTARCKGGVLYAEIGELTNYFRRMFKLTSWNVTLGATPRLTAIVDGGDRRQVYDVDTGGSTVKRWRTARYRFVRVSGIALTYNSVSGGLLVDELGWSTPPIGQTFGTLSVTMRFAR